MKTNQTTDKATARPWKMQQPRGPQHAIDRKWEIVSPLKSGGEMIIVGEHTGIECLNEANAVLIVQAVNEHAALVAVAEAAQQIVNAFEGRKFADGFAPKISLDEAETALENLAVVRNQSPVRS